MYYKGERVNLRAIRESDLKLAAEYLNDMEILLNLDDDAPLPMSEDKQKQWYSDHLKKKDIYHGFNLAIETKEGTFIGTCGVNHMQAKNKIAEVGIFIGNKAYLGKGYGTEAMKLLLDVIFNEMNMNKIEVEVFAFNERAIRSYEKCGFKCEVVSREAVFRYGKYHDIHIMSLFRDDYLKNKAV